MTVLRSVFLAVPALVLLAGCVSDDLAPSIWPPSNFALQVDEVQYAGERVHVTRRIKFDAQGVVVYGTSSQPLVDEQTGTSLPVFERLAIYQLEPGCVRALARKVARLIDGERPTDPGDPAPTGVMLRWRAFDLETSLASPGRPRGRFREILKEVAGYLPAGESFDAPITGVRRVLRGVPEPGVGRGEALAAYHGLVEQCPDDAELLLDGFALACAIGRRDEAQRWLARWSEATAAMRAAVSAFPDGPQTLQPAVLERLLPPEAEGE